MTWLRDNNTHINKTKESGVSQVDEVVSVLVVGENYKFKNQPERLKYIGKNWSGNGYWHQFEKVGEQGVWCELLDSDLLLIEKAH
tara:strand:+ start:3281 stop:3535 length:255 start_codon:yes stop_codon:yes gene_type:complete